MSTFIRFGSGLTKCAGDCGHFVPDYEAVVVDGETYCQDCGTHVEAEMFALAVDGLHRAIAEDANISARFAELFKVQ